MNADNITNLSATSMELQPYHWIIAVATFATLGILVYTSLFRDRPKVIAEIHCEPGNLINNVRTHNIGLLVTNKSRSPSLSKSANMALEDLASVSSPATPLSVVMSTK